MVSVWCRQCVKLKTLPVFQSRIAVAILRLPEFVYPLPLLFREHAMELDGKHFP